jgi:hypothetical protein
MVWDGAAAALSVGNIRFALAEGDYFANLAAPSPFLHFWSLAVEEQFYLVWPALLLLAAAAWRRKPRRGAWIVLFDVFLASLVAAVLLTASAPNWAFFSLPTRAFELAAGGLLAVGAPTVVRLPRLIVGPVGWIGAAAVVIAAFTFDSGLPFPGAIALVRRWLPSRSSPPACGSRLLGIACWALVRCTSPAASASLYLWHWPIFVLAGVAFGFGRQPSLPVALADRHVDWRGDAVVGIHRGRFRRREGAAPAATTAFPHPAGRDRRRRHHGILSCSWCQPPGVGRQRPPPYRPGSRPGVGAHQLASRHATRYRRRRSDRPADGRPTANLQAVTNAWPDHDHAARRPDPATAA